MIKIISDMTVEEKAGQMIICGFGGYSVTDEIKSMILDIHIGGVILFNRNIESPAQLGKLCCNLKSTAKGSSAGIPLFISIDHEGGRVARVDKPFTLFPPAKFVGSIGSGSTARRYSAAMARELAAIGINMNYFPVLDVHTNSRNPVIGDRSFGTKPDLVSKIGIEAIKGMRDGNIIPVAKHFPGHGGTSGDSHLELPVLNRSEKKLTDIDLPPFIAAISEKIDALMTAHVLYPALDNKNCATLSSNILKGLLRKQLGFKGIIISDDMCMKAVYSSDSIQSACISALLSGVDILIISQNIDDVKKVHRKIVKAIERGIIPISQIDKKLERILSLKKKYLYKTEDIPYDEAKDIIGNREHKSLAQEIARRYRALQGS